MGKTKKAASRGSGKPKKTNANGNGAEHKPARKTAEQLSDEQRQTMLFHHKRKLKPLINTMKQATAEVKKQYELAKKEGITKKDLDLAFLLDTDEGKEKVQAQVQRILDIDRYMGKAVGTQLEFFAKESADEKAFEAGRIAALEGAPRRAPEHLSQAGAQKWLAGHVAGVDQQNKAREDGFRPLSEAASDLAQKAGVIASLGTEPETHREAA